MNAAPPNVDNFGQPLPPPATAPPTPKAGGIVFTLAEGEAGKTHARLYGFDAETGAQVYSSGDEVASSANEAGISISGGHVLFVTSDDTLYAFGVSYERD
jgi:outer membrane protein assembly factor BamB